MPKIEHIITIKDRPKQAERRKGMIDPFIPKPPLGRRRLSQGRFFNLFDLGRLANGADAAYSRAGAYISPAVYTTSVGVGGTDGHVSVILSDPNSAAHWNSYIFSTSYLEWPEIYRNINTELDSYHIGIDGLGEYVTGKGFRIPDGITGLAGSTASTGKLKWEMAASEFFPYWLDHRQAIAPAITKVTNIPDYSSTAVSPPALDATIDVFLAPTVMSASGEGKEPGSPLPAFPYLPQTFYAAVIYSKSTSRSTFLANSTWDAIWAKRGSNAGLLTADEKAFIRTHFFNHGSQQLITFQADLSDWVHPNFNIPSGKTFYGTSGWGAAIGPTFRSRSTVQDGRSFDTGKLVAAVRKHLTVSDFEWYFYWAEGGPTFGSGLLLQNFLDL